MLRVFFLLVILAANANLNAETLISAKLGFYELNKSCGITINFDKDILNFDAQKYITSRTQIGCNSYHNNQFHIALSYEYDLSYESRAGVIDVGAELVGCNTLTGELVCEDGLKGENGEYYTKPMEIGSSFSTTVKRIDNNKYNDDFGTREKSDDLVLLTSQFYERKLNEGRSYMDDLITRSITKRCRESDIHTFDGRAPREAVDAIINNCNTANSPVQSYSIIDVHFVPAENFSGNPQIINYFSPNQKKLYNLFYAVVVYNGEFGAQEQHHFFIIEDPNSGEKKIAFLAINVNGILTKVL